jgi:c-di-GMP-binding flagellar brake protein YcgR
MKKLPIFVGTEIYLRLVKNQAIQAKSRILGARHGDFLIIEHPIVRYSDRLFAKISGEVVCRYVHDGELYDFTSQVRKSTEDGLTLIDYPSEFEVHALRKHPRIRVNIEAVFTPEEDLDQKIKGNITDISEGGCCIVFGALFAFAKNDVGFLDFSLPDKAQITALRSNILKIKHSRLDGTTELGLQFLGPPKQMETVSSFCHFCSFFEV